MQANTLKVGLTGGIASGKSTVSNLFANLGVPIIDADKIAKSLFTKGSVHLKKLQEKFGDQILTSEAELNRKKLRKIIFNSKVDLAWLNNLTHPLIAQHIQSELSALESPYVIVDIPLLINLKGEVPQHLLPFVERILVVDTTLENQIKRVMERDSVSAVEAKAIIDSQSSREQKLALANDISENNEGLAHLTNKVKMLHQYYLSLTTPSTRNI
jgi:dephospho-CoA kinase